MKVNNCEQGTPEWFQARLGIPTASMFDKVLTPTGKASAQAGVYANTLIADWLCGAPAESFESEWMKRGTELEPQARAFYEMECNTTVPQVGFVTNEIGNGVIGCSPDGLPDAGGLLEIKCPAPHTHVGYLIDGKLPTKYKPQVQGQMLVTETEWCDFLSYHPLMDPVLIRVERDDEYIRDLTVALNKLLDTIAERKQKLTDRGVSPIQEK